METWLFYVVDHSGYEFGPEGEDTRFWSASYREALERFNAMAREMRDDAGSFNEPGEVTLRRYHVPKTKKRLLRAIQRSFYNCEGRTLRRFCCDQGIWVD